MDIDKSNIASKGIHVDSNISIHSEYVNDNVEKTKPSFAFELIMARSTPLQVTASLSLPLTYIKLRIQSTLCLKFGLLPLVM